jgi:hypothetical protein
LAERDENGTGWNLLDFAAEGGLEFVRHGRDWFCARPSQGVVISAV